MRASGAMRRGAIGRALTCAGVLIALPGAAGATERLAICLEAPERQAIAAAALDRLVGTAQVELVAPPCPAPGDELHVGRFFAAGRRVRFRLDGDTRTRIEREVPWLDGDEVPLLALQRAGKLGPFSVMVEALLAERRLAVAWAAALAGTVKDAPGAGGDGRDEAGGARSGGDETPRGAGGLRRAGASGAAAAWQRGGGRVSAGASRRSDAGAGSAASDAGRISAETSADPSRASGAPVETTADLAGAPGVSAESSLGRSEAAGVSAETSTDPSGVPGVSAETSLGPSGAAGISAETSTDPSGASDISPETSFGRSGAAGISAETSTDPSGASDISPETSLGPSGAAGVSADTSTDPSGASRVAAGTPGSADGGGDALAPGSRIAAIPAPPSLRRPAPPAARTGPAIALQAGGGLRIRSPDFTATELALGAEVGPVYARGAWQPAADWELGGLPVSVEGLAFEAGALLPLFEADGLTLRLHGGILAERLAVRALYRDDAAIHADWDLGPVAGATVGMRADDALTIALAFASGWMPTARDTHIGTDGPSARLNAFSSRLGLEVRWEL